MGSIIKINEHERYVAKVAKIWKMNPKYEFDDNKFDNNLKRYYKVRPLSKSKQRFLDTEISMKLSFLL